jgi:hypothetical protein
MRDHSKLLEEHGVGVLHRPCDGGWCIVRKDGSTMLSGFKTYDEAWQWIEAESGKSWDTNIVRLVK